MDVEEQSIVEEYSSSLEDLTFNSKPLINVLTMLAEENSRFASSVTKLIEERIYKVQQQLKLPSLYLLDSIIKNVGGIYLNLIAQVLVKVFVSVFEKGDEKTRKDLYKLRHTWPQYFSAKVLHDVDVNINKIDPGWPITAVPPPSPSIHVNPKFLKKAEVVKPQEPIVVPDVSKENEKEVLMEHQKRLAELQRLQEEQLRLTEQEIQEHQLKRDLILKKQEQERKALMTQQQQVLLTLRLETELGETPESNKKTSITAVSTKAEMTPSTHNITTSRDPRLQRQEQTPHNNNNRSQQQGQKDNIMNDRQALDPRQRDKANIQRTKKNFERTQGPTVSNINSKRRSRSQSPSNERETKIQRIDGYPKNRDARLDLDKHLRVERQPKRRRSLDGTENASDTRIVFQDNQGQFEQRGYRGRGNTDRGRGDRGRGDRGRGDRGRGDRGRGDRGRGDRGRGGRGRDWDRSGKPNRDDKGQYHRGPRHREDEMRQRTVHLKPESHNSPQAQFDDIEPETVPEPRPLFSKEEVAELQSNEVPLNENDSESAPIPQELTLEHKSVILEEAKRRVEAGDISQEQYIELIDKLAEFYELQRQQELEIQHFDENIHEHNVNETPEVLAPPGPDPLGPGPRNQHGRGGRSNRRSWKRRPEGSRQPHRDGPPRKEQRIDEPWRRNGPPRSNPGFEGPPRPIRKPRMDDKRRDHPNVREGRPPMDRPGPPDGGPWRESERLPPHGRGSSRQHHPPQNIEELEMRSRERDPGMNRRQFDERFHHDEPLLDRGRPLHPEIPPLGHGRPVDHFQGPPGGPGHELPPHLRPAGPMPHPMEPVTAIRISGPPREIILASESEQIPVSHSGPPGMHHGPHPVEAGRHLGIFPEQGLPIAHHGEPGPHPGEPDLRQLIHHREPRPLLGEPGIPPLVSHGEPGLLPGIHPGEQARLPGMHPGEPGRRPVHLHRESSPIRHLGEAPDHPGQPGLYPGHQDIIVGPGQQGNPVPHGQPNLLGPGQGSPQRHGTATPPPSIPSVQPPTPSRMDKRTVDDLFSRLVQVGIIKVAEEPVVNTPPRIATPPTMQQPLMKPHPMVPHPVPSSSAPRKQGPPVSQASKMAPMNLQKLQEMIEKSREASNVIPIISLDPHDLKKRHSAIISLLYRGKQCSTCGLRFDGEAEAFYREHLDWHFRRNRREKDGRRIAHKQWFIPLKDWLEYEEITDPEEKAHSSFFDAEKPNTDSTTVNTQVGDGSCPVLPTDTEAESVCDICQEKFEQFWEETQEEWHYKEAVRVDGKTYHEMCYQDAKSNVEGTATEAEANVDNPESEEEPVQDTPEVKKETTEVKKEEDTKDTNKTPEEVPVNVKKEDQDTVVKVESVERSEPQCSESNMETNGVTTQSDVKAMNNEVKVKIEVTESTDSEVKIKEENKNEVDGEGTSVVKTETTDKD